MAKSGRLWAREPVKPGPDSICIENLPNEVLQNIFDFEWDRTSLQNLRQVNQRFEGLASRTLYRSVDVDLSETGLPRLKLLADSRHGQLVKVFQLCVSHNSFLTDQEADEVSILLRSALEHFSQINRISVTQNIGCGRTADKTRTLIQSFTSAFCMLNLSELRHLRFRLAGEKFLPDFIKHQSTEAPEWWKEMCSRLKSLDFDEIQYRGKLASEIDTFLRFTDNVEMISVSCKKYLWPQGKDHPCKLQQLNLYGCFSQGARLKKLIDQNATTLRVIEIEDTKLTTGSWEEVFRSVKSCENLKRFNLYRGRYYRCRGAPRNSFRHPDDRRHRGFLRSRRWADWHALADIARGVTCIKPIDLYPLMARTDKLNLDKVWKALGDQYCSLQEFWTSPGSHREREHDRLAASGELQPDDDFWPPGVNSHALDMVETAFGYRSVYDKFVETDTGIDDDWLYSGSSHDEDFEEGIGSTSVVSFGAL